jgi:hypothetical protein
MVVALRFLRFFLELVVLTEFGVLFDAEFVDLYCWAWRRGGERLIEVDA